MGASKLRRLNDPEYGKPAIYTIQFRDSEGDICQLPYSLKRRARASETEKSALALALQIVGFAVDPEDDNRRFAAWVALERPEAAAGRRGDWLRLIPEYKRSHFQSDALAQLEELCSILPEKWYCNIFDKNGVALRDSYGDVVELSNYDKGNYKELESSDFLMRAIA